MEFRILSGLDVRVEGRSLPAIAAKQRTILAILLLHPNEVLPIDLLVEGVWGERPPTSSRSLIKTYVWRLRQQIDGWETGDRTSRISTIADGYALRVHPGELDIERFEHLVRSGEAALADGDADLAAARLREALAQWPGEVLPDTRLEGRFAIELLALGERRLAVLEERVCLDMRLGRFTHLIPELQTLIAREPLHESWHFHLVSALHRSGRRMAALKAYSAARDILVTELGLEPGAELQALHRKILAEDRAGGDEPGRSVSSGSLGSGQRPGPGQPAQDPPRQLPPGLSAFIGRDAEISAIISSEQETRAAPAFRKPAVTVLTGPPGSGKTALAVHVAHQLRAGYPDGQLYASIGSHNGSARTTRQVLGGFLRALGRPALSQSITVDEMVELYRSLTAGRRMLVLLDDVKNEEQVRTLLPADGGSQVIVTSRRVLAGLEETRLRGVGPLDDRDATALLIHSSGRWGADDREAAVARMTSLCGGLALALRIAGARLAARPGWSFADLAARLENENGRLDELAVGDLNLRAAFRRSYQSLDGPAQRVFQTVGRVCRDDFTVADAAEKSADHLYDLERALERLADASLLAASVPGRFHVHPLLRIFAAECEANRPGRWYPGSPAVSVGHSRPGGRWHPASSHRGRPQRIGPA